MNHLALIILPLLFLAMIIFILQAVVPSSTLETASENISGNATEVIEMNQFPTWNSTYENHQYVLWEADLNFFDGNTTNNWQASFPDGWFIYAGDWLTALGSWFVDIFQTLSNVAVVIGVFLIPPTAVSDIAFGVLVIVYAFMYVLLGIGLSEYIRKWLESVIPF